MGTKCEKCGTHYGIGCEACPNCGQGNPFARAKHTPRVEARLLAKARGFDGDDTNTINERLNNGND